MNPMKVGLLNRVQVRKSKAHDECTISHGPGISYVVFTSGHMLSTCTNVEYIFLELLFCLLSFICFSSASYVTLL